MNSIGDLMPSTIAAKTEQGNSSVSRILHTLLEKKFITIDADYLDRRSVFVKITDMGRELFSTVEKLFDLDKNPSLTTMVLIM